MSDGIGNFLSPEGLIMLPLAMMLDLTGIILVIFGLDDFFITDAIGWLTIGTWSMFYSQIKSQTGGSTEEEVEESEEEAAMPGLGERRKAAKEVSTMKEAQKTAEAGAEAEKVAGQAEKAAGRAAKWGKRLKFLEFIPYVGALPLWTISVYFELKD